MAPSGCKGVEFGTDSGSAAMIANLQKEFDADDLRRASRLCHRFGLKFCHSLIFGGPGETRETVAETIGLMDELEPTAVIAFTGIRVLPGTGMVEIALRDGQIDADDNLLYPKFYIAQSLGEEVIDASRTTRRGGRTGSSRERASRPTSRCCSGCATRRSRASCGGCCAGERGPRADARSARSGHPHSSVPARALARGR